MRASLSAAFLVACTAAFAQTSLTGTVGYIEDGDTFSICEADRCTKIRLCGIDAPERAHAGYQEAKTELDRLTRGKIVQCIWVGRGTPCDGRSKPTNRKRVVAQCFVEGSDLAAELANNGFACDWTKFSGGYYSRDGLGRPCPEGHRE
jgi:endonuclease YncB( thermonuclease family)